MATIIPNATGAYLLQVSRLEDRVYGPIISKTVIVGWAVPDVRQGEFVEGREMLHRVVGPYHDVLGSAVPVIWDNPLLCDETWIVSDAGVDGSAGRFDTVEDFAEYVWRRWLDQYPSSPAPQHAPLWVRITRNGQP